MVQQPNKVSFEALLSAVVQDALNSGVISSQNLAPSSSLTQGSSLSAVIHPPGSIGLPSASPTQKFQLQHQSRQSTQKMLQKGHEFSRAQLPQPASAALLFSPSSETAIPQYRHSVTVNHNHSDNSHRPLSSRASTPFAHQHTPSLVGPNNPPASSATSPSNVTSSSHYSGASSVLQTPSPLLDAQPPDSTTSGHEKPLDNSSICPAKISTHGDCHDHAHVRGKPVLHVCHWQNCHSSFSTVQALLQHISQSHLGLSVGEAGAALPADQMAIDTDHKPSSPTDGALAGMPSHPAKEAAYIVAGIDPSDPYSGNSAIPLTFAEASQSSFQTNMPMIPLLGSTAAVIQQPSADPFPGNAQFGFAGNANQDMQAFSLKKADQDTLQSMLGLAGLDGSQSGPMACLWDDCPPFDPFAHFGQQCLDEACGLPPTTGNATTDFGGFDAGTSIDAMMLTCNPACTEEHTHMFPCEPSCPQEHAHIHPMHLHSYSQHHSSAAHNVQLDSATAVLKHLLQQHLGVDLTQGLLNVASQQLGDETLQTMTSGSRDPNETQRTSPEIESTTTIPSYPQQSMGSKRSNTTTKKCKPLRAPPRRPSDTIPSDERSSHVCRWHNCSESFESVEDLTEHLSEVHVGKGKADYECLWEGCQVCDRSESGHTSQPAKGRLFTTRQKIMRHMQVSLASYFQCL